MIETMWSARTFLEGDLIREPAGPGQGYWVGAPGVYFDEPDGVFYLTYRVRRPRGVEPDRGGVARIARSTDGIAFHDIWDVNKSAYGTTSIERSAIRRGPDGKWRYYTSYVDAADGRWCTVMLTADAPDAFDPAAARPVFTAADLGLEGVKDPFLFEHGGVYHMLLSVALPTQRTGQAAHATHDIYNTGQCLSATGLATSRDLDAWRWEGVVFEPEPGAVGTRWDGYCRRINSVIAAGDRFLGFYDGGRDHEQNYEERTALALSPDLRAWRTLHPEGPAVLSPHASGSIRYADAVALGDEVALFYELARADGAHELRTTRVRRDALERA